MKERNERKNQQVSYIANGKFAEEDFRKTDKKL
jgi:uncharacterized protein YozE (UPF0346 family)